MNDLIRQFPDATKKDRRAVMYVPEPPVDPSLARRLLRKLFLTLFIVGAATIGGIVILILMGALKLLGVKEL
jgi:hypothetical protein